MLVTTSAQALHHILLIEDEPGYVRLIREALCCHPHIHLHAVADVVQALHFLTRREKFADAPSPSLIILDLRLPIFSGKSLLEERRRHGLSDAPVVVLTSLSSERIDCMIQGATEFHLKPDEWLAWQRLIHHLVQKHLRIDLYQL